MTFKTFKLHEKTYSILAMLSISLVVLTGATSGLGLIEGLQNMNIKSIWWLLGIYA